jgi:dGTPase
LFDDYRREALREYPALAGRRVLYEAIRRMLSAQVYDVIGACSEAFARHRPHSVDEVRHAGPLVGFGPAMAEASQNLKRFLMRNLYRHPQVTEVTVQAKAVVCQLFTAYQQAPAEMAGSFAVRAQAKLDTDGPAGQARVVADYVAGMTDRFASREHERLTGQKLLG